MLLSTCTDILKDIWEVYHTRLGFLTGVDPSIIPHEWAAYGEHTEKLFSELADALESLKLPLALNVAHGVSIVCLAAGLKIFPLRGPPAGQGLVLELRLGSMSMILPLDLVAAS